MTKIISTATLKPDHTYSTDQIIEAANEHWLGGLDTKTRRTAIMLLKAAHIHSRSSILPLETIFSDMSFEEKNNHYKEAMIDLGTRVLVKALDSAGLRPVDVDYIITTSCTGFMIPSVDAYIINRLEMRQDINRLPVTEMGCAGGTSGLIYAYQFLKANPGKKVALISVETPSITLQKNDLSMENLVSSSIFADGASCVILGETEELRPRIMETGMYHFPHDTHLMGYDLQNSGLKIILDRDVPNEIEAHFPKILPPFLAGQGLTPQDVEHYMFHPGGKKIINMVEKYISRFDKDISDSKAVLEEHGNMSSSTILFILDRFMKKEAREGDRGYMLAFGPGFMAQQLLLRWE
jgi:predicted naringenin-chalcone synthase